MIRIWNTAAEDSYCEGQQAMSSLWHNTCAASVAATLEGAANRLWDVPPGHRPGVVVRALACFPEISLEASFASGPLRAALSLAWEQITDSALPIDFVRQHLAHRDDEKMVSAICGVAFAESPVALNEQLAAVLVRIVELQTQRTSIARCKDERR